PDGPRPPVAALRFCGEPATAGRSYCAEHHAAAYLRPGERWNKAAPAEAEPWRRLFAKELFPSAPSPAEPKAPARRSLLTMEMAA
ncbi:hypothetical protein ACFOD3_10550, partial [Falsiroseomonas tokyonensis]|nr:hypothetical protein [Falsiroseomonas tokyonensis]